MSVQTIAARSAAAACLLAALASGGALAADAAAPADPAVQIRATVDDKGDLVLRYRAPADVTHLVFADRGRNMRDAVRTAFAPQAADNCARLDADGMGLTLSHGSSCAEGATFTLAPRVLNRNATYEPAQPTSDRGVLLHTGAWTAVAPGHPLRWEFVPPKDGAVVDEGARSSTMVVRQAPAAAIPASGEIDDATLAALHASHDVFLGRTPIVTLPGLVVVRDPALPTAMMDALTETARAALAAYGDAAGASPAGPVGVVMLAVQGEGWAGFHGDRSDGRMLRLSFHNPAARPTETDVQGWRQFVAHEVAHLWNHGVWQSDDATPWLHEGDAQWASMTMLVRAGQMTPGALRDQLEQAVNACVLARGDAPSATMRADWRSHDDPYACGLALNLLAWTIHPDPAGPLAGWGARHRAAPSMTVAAFVTAAEGDAAPAPAPAPASPKAPAKGAKPKGATPVRPIAPPPAPSLRTLLLDPSAPFAETYLAALGARVPLEFPASEPASDELKRSLARRLWSELSLADCDGLGFTTRSDDILIDRELVCRHKLAGRRLATIAGQALLAHPVAAWRMAAQACSLHAEVTVGFSVGLDETIPCPTALSPLPRWVRLPDDLVARLHLADAGAAR